MSPRPEHPTLSDAEQQYTSIKYPTLLEIKSSLPKECFKAELGTSIYYVVRSVVLVLALGTFAYLFSTPSSSLFVENSIIRAALWVAYWHFQGIIFWGIFVLGHDCGHGSFSRFPKINQIFGNFLHASILVPYESWKVTHKIHHKNTGNIDKDEIFYPHREDNSINLVKRLVVVTLSAAWMLYLYGKRHFNVNESIFNRQRIDVVISIASWAVAAITVGYACNTLGYETVLFYYGFPLFSFMGWLVVTTFLHHQDEDAPWFGNEQWTYVKGNLSSIDRSYGYGIDNLIHNIGTHQIHHLFPKIPHYKLLTATDAFRKQFPQFVRQTDESILVAFFRNWLVYVKYAVAPKGVQYFCYREEMKKSGAKLANKTA